jgi:dienelactone hydrolase
MKRLPRVLAGGCVLLLTAWAAAEPIRVLPAGKLPDDRRLAPLKTLNDYFPFAPCKSKEAWTQRAEALRQQILVAEGLWPTPTPTPHRPVVHGLVDRDTYTVEKVFLESYPGHFVTGNLYRPKGCKGPVPAVLCPHGHWPNGRFYDAGPKLIRKQLVEGAERFEFSGRFPVQARCVQLARMGCLVFHYDMVGYADSIQLQHRAGSRPALNTPQNWGYFSPQAEARLQTVMGLQTYNSIAALDWVASLPEVDRRRIAVTGCSGGGTQTFILCAIDQRPAVSFPVVMVSTAMQGGCTCENACYLRVGSGNVEIAALVAPRPLGMVAADDWTKEMMTKGMPELQITYKLLGVPANVACKANLHFPHNYNYVSRAVMYSFLNKHLKLGFEDPIVEEDFKPLTEQEMSVWDTGHPKPPAGDDYERSLLRTITQDCERQMAKLVPHDRPSLDAYRKIVGRAVGVMIDRRVPPAGAVVAKSREEADLGLNAKLARLLLRNASEGEETPALLLESKAGKQQRLVIWVSREGKQSLFDASGKPQARVTRLLASGAAVLGIDLFGQGEFTADGRPLAKAELCKSGRGDWASYLGYTYGYNHPLFSRRVHDILAAVSFARHTLKPAKLEVCGLDGAGHWVLAAGAQAGPLVDRLVADTAGFRFGRLSAIDDPDFLPGGAKYLDLPGIAALCAPTELSLADEPGRPLPAVITAAYRAAGKASALRSGTGD